MQLITVQTLSVGFRSSLHYKPWINVDLTIYAFPPTGVHLNIRAVPTFAVLVDLREIS